MFSTTGVFSQVRYLQQCRKKQRPQEQNLRRVRRTSSRRSAYAFSHQQGYGELITSGKNMRMSTVSSAHCPERIPHSSSWIENMLKRNNEVSCISDESTEASENSKRHTEIPKQQCTEWLWPLTNRYCVDYTIPYGWIPQTEHKIWVSFI